MGEASQLAAVFKAELTWLARDKTVRTGQLTWHHWRLPETEKPGLGAGKKAKKVESFMCPEGIG
jgi:hypothetical protein